MIRSIILLGLVSCGTLSSPFYQTRQGVKVYTEQGDPATGRMRELDDALDDLLADWAVAFNLSAERVRCLAEHLGDISIYLWEGHIDPPTDCDSTEAICTVNLNGMHLENRIDLQRKNPCWGRTSLAHELAHWFLWKTAFDADGEHVTKDIWGVPNGWVFQQESFMVRKALCPELYKDGVQP